MSHRLRQPKQLPHHNGLMLVMLLKKKAERRNANSIKTPHPERRVAASNSNHRSSSSLLMTATVCRTTNHTCVTILRSILCAIWIGIIDGKVVLKNCLLSPVRHSSRGFTTQHRVVY